LLLVVTLGQFADPDTEFSREVVAAYPRLVAADVTDHERVVMLRQWAWSHTNSATVLWDSTVDTWWANSDAPEWYARYANGEGGSICGDTAFGLMKLYRYFGYKAWYLGSCGGSNVGHATTLVEIPYKGSTRRIIQDALYNEEFRDVKVDEPLDYFDMLRRLVDKRHNTIRVCQSDYHQIRPWPKMFVQPQFRVGYTNEQCAANAGLVIDAAATFRELESGTLEITSPRGWFEQVEKKSINQITGYPEWHLKRIVDNGHPPTMLYYFRWCHRVSPPGIEADAIKAHAVEIAGPAPTY